MLATYSSIETSLCIWSRSAVPMSGWTYTHAASPREGCFPIPTRWSPNIGQPVFAVFDCPTVVHFSGKYIADHDCLQMRSHERFFDWYFTAVGRTWCRSIKRRITSSQFLWLAVVFGELAFTELFQRQKTALFASDWVGSMVWENWKSKCFPLYQELCWWWLVCEPLWPLETVFISWLKII